MRQETRHRRRRQLDAHHHLHLLTNPDARYQDLGADFYESRANKQRRQRDLIRQLEHLTGQKVALQSQPELPSAA